MVSEADANVYGDALRKQLRTALDKIEKAAFKERTLLRHAGLSPSEADANIYGDEVRKQLRTALNKWQSKGLSPYHHELNDSGTACAEHCPACRWVAEQSPKQTTSFEQESIDECERIWELEDNR